MTILRTSSRCIAFLVAGTFLAAMPMAVTFDTGGGFRVGVEKALAKDGRDDDGGGSNSGSGKSGGGGGGGDDDGGGRGGSDDGAGDDHRGRGRGGDDAPGDDNGGGRRGGAAAVGGGAATGGGLQVVKIERTASGVEVVYSNGIKEEIEGGRYELKNPAGRTVVERAATPRDLARINGNARASAVAPGAVAAARTLALPRGSQAQKVEIAGDAIEVVYASGWKEEIEGGRYELKDPNNNTVVERPATGADRNRLLALSGN